MVFQHELDTVNPSLLNKYIFVKTDCSNESHVCIQRRIENIARGTTDPKIDSVTCISCKFGNQMALLVLVANLTTRWHHLHKLQIWLPDGATCISYKFIRKPRDKEMRTKREEETRRKGGRKTKRWETKDTKR